MSGFVGFITAWLLVFMLLFVLAKTRAGHTVIYYVAWALVLLLIVTHSKQITGILQRGNL